MKKKLGQILNWIIFAIWLWWAIWGSVRTFYPKPYPPLDKMGPLTFFAALSTPFLDALRKKLDQDEEDEDDLKFFGISIQVLVIFPIIIGIIRTFLLR